MKCFSHSDTDAVANCIRCGCGICQECVTNTQYQIDNKPLCTKCNYEVGCENDAIFKSVLKSKKIKFVIFAVTFLLGLIVLFTNLNSEYGNASAVIGMLFCWGLGFIGNFFDKQPDNRSVKAQTKEAMLEIKHPISSLVGKIFGFFILAVSSPIQIVLLYIGISKVKKQIAENEAIVNNLRN